MRISHYLCSWGGAGCGRSLQHAVNPAIHAGDLGTDATDSIHDLVGYRLKANFRSIGLSHVDFVGGQFTLAFASHQQRCFRPQVRFIPNFFDHHLDTPIKRPRYGQKAEHKACQLKNLRRIHTLFPASQCAIALLIIVPKSGVPLCAIHQR